MFVAGIAAMAIVPSAFAHHGRIGGSMTCQGLVSYTASAWQTSSTLARTHNDVRLFVTQSNGAAVSPPQQVGSGKFNAGNDFSFSGTFTVPAGVSSVKLTVVEFGNWGNGTGSSNGTNPESSVVILRQTTGCAPPPPQCPAGANAQVSSSSQIGVSGGLATVSFTVAAGCESVKLSFVSYKAPGPAFDATTADQQTVHDAKTVLLSVGNHTLTVDVPGCYYQVDFVYGDVIARFGPAGSSNFYSAQGRLIRAVNGGAASCAPTPVDQCPNIAGNQATVPSGMIKDGSGNCVTPPPPPVSEQPPPTVTVASAPVPLAQPAAPVTATTTATTTQPKAKTVPKARTAGPKAKPKIRPKVKKAPVKTKRPVVEQQPTAKRTKPRALPFTR